MSRDPLARVLLPSDTDDSLHLRVGNVSDAAPLEVEISAQAGLTASLLVPYANLAAVNAGDRVAVIQTKTGYLVLGKIVPGE